MSLTRIVPGIFLFILLNVVFFTLLQPLVTEAAAADNVSGYAWSENIGWISMNSINDGGSDYGVTVAYDGAISGYAWSENIGWISFSTADLTGCPTGTCAAVLDRPTGQVSGWARALSALAAGGNSGGWDGWISLSGTTSDASSYGVSVNSACDWTGYAWGSTVVGWINFGDGVSGTGYACTGSVPALVADQLPTVDLLVNVTNGPAIIGSGVDYDISWSTSNVLPVQVGGAVVREEARAIAVSNNYAFVLVNSSLDGDEFEVYDISNPLVPSKIAGLDYLASSSGSYAWGRIALNGNYAYVIGDNSQTGTYRVIDISNPSNPVLVQTNNLATSGIWVTLRDAVVSGSHLYLTGQGLSGGPDFLVFDVSNPASPSLVSQTILNGHAWGLAIDANTAYVGLGPVDSSTPTFQVLDISDKANPTIISATRLRADGAYATEIVLNGAHAYLGLHHTGVGDDFEVIDISNPNVPVKLDGVDIGGNVFSINLSGDGMYAYAARHAGTPGIGLVDISNPTSLVYVGLGNGTDEPVDTVVVGDYIFAAAQGSGDLSFEVFDTSFGCTASNGTTGWPGSKKLPGGSEIYSEGMAGVYSYLLTCTNGDGVASDTVEVTITPVPNLTADIGSLNASPTFDITTGYYDYLTLNYNVRNTGSGEAVNSVLRFNTDYGHDGSVDDVVNVNIPMLLPLSQTGTHAINLGSNIAPGNHSVEILVDADDDVTEADEDDNLFIRNLTVNYPDPGISLTSVPDRIVRSGSNVDLSWDLNGAGYIASCEIDGPTLADPQVVYSGGVPTTGTLSSVGPITSKSEFLLRCVAVDGISVFTDIVTIETTGTVEEI